MIVLLLVVFLSQSSLVVSDDDMGFEFMSKINTAEELNLTLYVDGDSDTEDLYTGEKDMEIKTFGEPFLSFKHNFSEDSLDLSNMIIKKGLIAKNNYIIVSDLYITGKKTIFLKKNNLISNAVCVLDSPVRDARTLQSECKVVECPGSDGKILCSIMNEYLAVSNLEHSGVLETVVEKKDCLEKWKCTDWTPSACPVSGRQTRFCKDTRNCGTDLLMPAAKRNCDYLGVEGEDPSCGDGVQNQDETGVDCGGPCEACIQMSPLTTESWDPVIYLSVIIAAAFILIGVVVVSLYEKNLEIQGPAQEKQNIYDNPTLNRLANYIIQALSIGYSKEQVRQILIKQGWEERLVDYVMVRFKDSPKIEQNEEMMR